jgi:hypothetical protein
MDPVSFTIGVFGLVGTFTACVDCFEYFRIGRSLGEDYEICIVKLDLVRLRFTRWGESVGIGNIDEDTAVAGLKSKLIAPETEFITIMRTLGQILRLFESAAETSNILAMKAARNLSVADEDVKFEDGRLRDLHEAMRNLATRRQKRSSILQKTTWALYRKKDFTGLIENLTDLVTSLVEVVPLKPQQVLCHAEVEEINNDQSLVALEDVLRDPVGEDDTVLDRSLYETVVRIIEERKISMTQTIWRKSKAGDGTRIRQGDYVGSDYQGPLLHRDGHHLVEDSEFGTNVVFHQGHSYGGRE